jgi:hypothetical protein
MKRDHICKTFEEIPSLKGRKIHEIKCWNFSAVIDEKKNLYVWGALISNVPNEYERSSED